MSRMLSCILFCFVQVESLNPVSLMSAGRHHQQPADQQRPPVVWLHVHKSAGTEMCNAAKQNGEQVPHEHGHSNLLNAAATAVAEKLSIDSNCNLIEDDVLNLHKAVPLQRLTCEQRRDMKLSWMQIEREFDENDFCEGMLYGTAIRDPAALAESAVNFYKVGEDYKECLRWPPAEDCAAKNAKHAMGFLNNEEPMFVYFDNFLVRILCGRDVMMLPPGAVNASHAEKAKSVLAKFDIVLRVEDLHTEGALTIFNETLGWMNLESFASHANEKWHKWAMTPDELQTFKDGNKFDYEIYSSIKQM
eukprot:TRINITY_DN29978_c0_g1_i1.p1 TRINITY_DN29978_c0_g1~~TRINITY_DN29978_c0_g1_i1.p1  ORF type:complete len:341 (+),score=63.61 TRINITY_DN29978_c0_g1_i1:114-1025(+)